MRSRQTHSDLRMVIYFGCVITLTPNVYNNTSRDLKMIGEVVSNHYDGWLAVSQAIDLLQFLFYPVNYQDGPNTWVMPIIL